VFFDEFANFSIEVIYPTPTLCPRAPSLEQVQFTLPIAWRGSSNFPSLRLPHTFRYGEVERGRG